MCEILAPAGDAAAFYAGIHSGADAVYLGLTDFSARKSAANFSLENLKGHIDYAHALGVRVHVALNTLVKNGEIERFLECARGAWNAGADALIIQDVFLGKRLKEAYPEMVLHLSTQAGVCNLYGARLAKRYGFSRVILARETPLEGIAAIAKEIETEVFVQGALCTCFSGQCYLSAMIGGNSGNRGACKQPCRKKYKIDRKGFDSFSYKLSLADLCMGQDVKKLAAAGVASFKIEGRMRSAAYVGAAVRYYRDILDGTGDVKADLSDLQRTYNRGDYTTGYVFGQARRLISSSLQGHKGEKVGVIASGKDRSGKRAFVRSSYVPADGDGFKIIRGDAEIGGGSYSGAFPKAAGGFYLPAHAGYREGDGVYLTLDTSLAARVEARRRRESVSMIVCIAEGERPAVMARGRFGEREWRADFIAAPAKTLAISEKDVADCFAKTDTLPLSITLKKIEIIGNPFVVKSALNAFRREVYAQIFALLAGERRLLAPRRIAERGGGLPKPPFRRAVVLDDLALAEKFAERFDCVIFSPKNYNNFEEIKKFIHLSKYYAWHKWLYMPAFMTDADLAAAENAVREFEGVYAEGVWAAEFCRATDIKLFAGTGFNLFNRLSLETLAEEDAFLSAAISKELSQREGEDFSEAFRFAGGAIKVMELGHCLFGKHCTDCDRRARYVLTDEQGRAFALRRYESSCCRFELFNCAPLAPQSAPLCVYDLRTLQSGEICALFAGEKRASFTSAISSSGVL